MDSAKLQNESRLIETRPMHFQRFDVVAYICHVSLICHTYVGIFPETPFTTTASDRNTLTGVLYCGQASALILGLLTEF